MSSNLKKDFNICVGVITSVSGVKGYVKVRSFTESPDDLARFDRIFDENQNEYKINLISTKRDALIIGVEGIDNRNDAEKLRNTKLFIERSALPKVANDEYYHADLIGMEVVLSNGYKYGMVKNIVNFGAGDIIEIYSYDAEKLIYYPFTKQYVPHVDFVDSKIVLQPLEEILATDD